MYNLTKLKRRVANLVPNSIRYEFDPALTVAEMVKAKDPENWKVHIREQYYLILDCKPFDDQLRCYVHLDSKKNVIRIVFSTE